MIKIEPLFATDCTQTRALLRHQNERMPYESFCAEDALSLRGLTFWQHWMPCRIHMAPSVYIAKEGGVVLGLISLRTLGKSRACWRIDHLVVHPNHRGRGIAQELLKFAFALFGSQGVSHFIAEVSDQNSAALNLMGNCGFRRCAKVTEYQVPSDFIEPVLNDETSHFRLAMPEDKLRLYQLHQDALPPDHRLIYEWSPEDFAVSDLPVENFDRTIKRLIKGKTWFWVSQDSDRKALTSAVRVTAHQEGDYHLEFAVHPGYLHMAEEIVVFTLGMMKRAGMRGVINAKGYDYQAAVVEALEKAGLERTGSFSLLAREHWMRAKQPRTLKLDKSVNLAQIPAPAVNLPRTASGGGES
jgi:ribosomal protein S18 acetylase RimI-like enzyme